jgi:O-antigen/teichoic acid export membrane protein
MTYTEVETPIEAMESPSADSPGRRLARNSGFGLVSFVVPSLVLLVAYPLLIHRIGADAFGIFVLASGLASSMALLDPGLTPATTHFVARDMAAGRRDDAARAITTSLVLYMAIGLVGSGAIWLAAPWMASTFAGGAVDRDAAAWVFRLAGVQIEAWFLINVCAGTFKGLHRFDWAALVISALAVASYGPAIVASALWGSDLVRIILAYTAGYIAVAGLALGMLVVAARRYQIPIAGVRPSLAAMSRLVRFGIFMLGNSVASFLLNQVQRFAIGAMIGPAAVTVYQLATTIPSKVASLIASATESLFPFASSSPSRQELRRTYLRMLAGSALVALVLLATLTIGRGPILDWWLGARTAAAAADVLPLFAAAYFLLSLTPAPYYLANGMGKPHLNMTCYLLDGAANVVILVILILLPGGLTLAKVGWAFLAANLLYAIVYQALAELVLWRRWRPAERAT